MGTNYSNGDTIMDWRNKTFICTDPRASLRPMSIWHGGNPLLAPSALLFFQVSIISLVSRLIDVTIRPLWQSSVVSQIFSGLVFGPSLLGHQRQLLETFFPRRGHITLEMFAVFGVMFSLFSICSKMDINMMTRPGKRAMIVGCSALFVTQLSSVAFAFLLTSTIPMDPKLASALPILGASQCLTSFPVIVCLLTELKMLNTDMGRLALSSSMFCDFVSMILFMITSCVLGIQRHVSMNSLYALTSLVVYLLFVVYVLKPIATRIRSSMVRGNADDDRYILAIFMMLLLSSYVSEVIGQHYFIGTVVFGLVLQDGPPLATAIAAKVDSLGSTLLYPTYCAITGLGTDIFSITYHNFVIVYSVFVFAFITKVVFVMLPAWYFKIPLKDSFVLALILNARGIVELLFFNSMKDEKIFNDEEYALAVTSVVLVTALVTPLIKLLYNPTDQLTQIGRTTVQQQSPELRMLVCIHKHESILPMLNLLQVSHGSEQSPLAMITMTLVELEGRTAPFLIEMKKTSKPSTFMGSNTTSGKVIASVNQFYDEYCNKQQVSLKSFTSVSYFESMHEDICRVSTDERANIVILPFHKQYQINSSIVSAISLDIQNINIKVLEKAPCSVAILVDRGIYNGPVTMTTNKPESTPVLRIGVLFIGGPDDVESLAYGARMVQHDNVQVTVIRYLLFGCDKTKERKSETNLIDEYRHMNAGNERFNCVEEVVRDGEDLASSIKVISDCFDMILVGRYHPQSQLTAGLDQWSECPELGVIGDMLASADYGVTATVLVVQQNRVGRSLLSIHRHLTSKDRESANSDNALPNDQSGRPAQGQSSSSWAITVDK